MSVPVSAVTITPGISQRVSLQNGNIIKAVKLSNKAPYDLVVDGLENTGPRWQAAGIEEWYFPNGTCQGTCDLTAFNNANLSSPAAGIVLITPYYMNDTLPKNAGQSTTIPTQVVQANVSTIQVLQNIGQPPGTQWLDVQPNKSTGGLVSGLTWNADNLGNLQVQQDVSDTLTMLLQLIAGGANPIQLLGNLVNWSATGDYNGQNLNLGKRKILSIQNGAGTAGNVFGVDANDNTFVQHNSNNQTIIYDKNGNSLITIDASGNTIYNNNTALKWKDTGSNVNPILQVNNFNQTQLFGINGADVVQFLKHDGTLQALIDLIKGCINLSTPSTVTNGGTAGTATMYMPFQGGAFKLVIINEVNFQTGASNQDVSLPTSFANGCYFWTGSVVTFNFLKAGVAQSCNIVTALASGGGTSTFQANVGSYSFGNMAPNQPFDAIRHLSGAGSQHTGFIVLIGN